MKPNSIQIERIRSTLLLQYQGIEIEKLITEITITLSKKTGRIRGIYDKNHEVRLFSLRTSDGRFLPTFDGGKKLLELGYQNNLIVMNKDAAPFIASGKSAFCKHVVEISDGVVPESEVLLVNEQNQLLAVGTAQQPSYAIRIFTSGIAAKVKHYRD